MVHQRWIARAYRFATVAIALPLAAALAIGPASATVVTSGCDLDDACILQELFDGATITVNDKLFSNWTLIAIETNSTLDEVDTGDILVSGLDDGGLEPGPGLFFDSFAAIEAVGDGQEFGFVAFAFAFDVSVLDPTLNIKDNSLSLDATFFDGDGGFVEVFEILFDESGNFVGEKAVFEDNLFDDAEFFDSAEFDPTSFLTVEVDIVAFTDNLDETAAIDAFSMRFSQTAVPGPATLGLFGVGLAGLGLAARRRKTR